MRHFNFSLSEMESLVSQGHVIMSCLVPELALTFDLGCSYAMALRKDAYFLKENQRGK